MRDWIKSGAPWIWLTAGAVAAAVLAVAGVMALTALRGLGHFWPKPVAETTFKERDGRTTGLIGELRDREEVAVRRLREAGFEIPGDSPFAERGLVKMGNRDVTGADFRWYPLPLLGDVKYPQDIVTIERREWGNFYGHLVSVKEPGQVVASGEAAWPELQKRFERANGLFNQIYTIEKNDIGRVNYGLEHRRPLPSPSAFASTARTAPSLFSSPSAAKTARFPASPTSRSTHRYSLRTGLR